MSFFFEQNKADFAASPAKNSTKLQPNKNAISNKLSSSVFIKINFLL